MKTNTYESMVLLDNREVRQGWQALKDNVTGLFSKHQAEILSARRWQETRLAYPIKGQQRGTYLLVYFKAPTDQITAIRRELEYDESVLRYLTLAVEEIPESAYEPEEEFDESQVKVEEAGDPVPDEPAESDEKAEADKKGSDKKDGDKKDAEKAGSGSEAKAEGSEATAKAEGDAPAGDSASSEETKEDK